MSDLTQRIVDSQDAAFSKGGIRTIHLLEASAGTGKTYSIQTLYLRLVLVEGMSVQQILVVTFTKDATKELRDRLQRILREALDHLGGRPAEERTRKLVDKAVTDQGEGPIRERLQLALLDFDMASIFTIHGFCQRVLNRFAFETRQPFDVEPAGDTSDEIEQLCKDWWRKNLYLMDAEITGFLSVNNRFSLKAITALAGKLISKPDAVLDAEPDQMQPLKGKLTHEMEKFVVDNSALPTETQTYPGALPEIAMAVGELQRQVKEFRSGIKTQEWDKALSALDALTGFSKTVPVTFRDTDLVQACEAFMQKVPSGTRAASFTWKKGHLESEKCPSLGPGLTEAVKVAVQALGLKHRVDEYAPAKLRRTKAFEKAVLLDDCFRKSNPVDCEAKLVFAAIKDVYENGAGLVEEVVLTADCVNPAIKTLGESLLNACGAEVVRAALEVKDQYRKGRPAATTASYDDYLLNLREALKDPVGGKDLVDVLRKEFCAALIDEFQDTDPIQWGIFERLFKDAGIPCFLVGDPKQAIYRFRNGDVETYLDATRSIVARYPLGKNFRSEQRLIDAVNQVFMDAGGRQTFGAGIEYKTPLEAAGKDQNKSLLINGKPDDKPFKIVLVDNGPDNKGLPGQDSVPARAAYAATAKGIASLLLDKSLTIGGKSVKPKDIAVLVNTHRQGEYIAGELRQRGIPAVRQGTGDVWDSGDGRILWMILESVLDARNLSCVRYALMSDWVGLTPGQIQILNQGRTVPAGAGEPDREYGMEDWVVFFEGLRETWQDRGFPAMFRELSGKLGLKKRLLGLDACEGQRRLTNINHLAELVERAITDGRKTPEGALAWIRQQFDRGTKEGGDEVKLRLETDDDAVRIMTVFTSKGLEFPIVFAPTLFMMNPKPSRGLYEFHEGASLRIAVAKKGDKASEAARKNEKDEITREHVRQIYVALTRAVHRMVVMALDDGAKDGRAKKNEVQKFKMRGILGEVLRLPMKTVECDGRERGVVDEDHVQDRFGHIGGVASAVEVTRYDEKDEDRRIEPGKRPELKSPADRPKPDTSRGHGSFSSLAPSGKKEEMKPVAPAETDDRNRDGETAGQPVDLVEQKPVGIFAFPSGARTGTCWHEIFEDLSFDADDAKVREMVETKLRIHGFLKNKETGEERIHVTTQMVCNVLRTPLPGLDGQMPFALSGIPDRDRKTEWAFSFSALAGKRTAELREIVSGYKPYRGFTDAIGDWDKAIPGGYLTGFVDLLFRHNGRYYIVDWKSNRRNGKQADFCQQGLTGEMTLHGYWLQYLIYTVAVHQYLSKAMADYRYEQHFGGVYYIFLRGVDGQTNGGGTVNGIFADRPPEALVAKLSGILGDFT